MRSDDIRQQPMPLQLLRAALRNKSDLECCLRIVSETDALSKILEYALRNKTANDPWKSSYRHDNGFIKIVLFRDCELGAKLRLHIWQPQPRTSLGSYQKIHNHRWDFASRVFLGNISQRCYRLGERGDTYHHYRYYSRANNQHYEIEKLGVVRADMISSRNYESGEIYSATNDVLHQMMAPHELYVATLVLTRETSGWKTNDLLSRKPLGEGRFSVPSPSFDSSDLCDLMKEFLQKITN